MLWELSQSIFSDEKLYGADLAAKKNLRMLMRGQIRARFLQKVCTVRNTRAYFLSCKVFWFHQIADLVPMNYLKMLMRAVNQRMIASKVLHCEKYLLK